MKKKIKKMTAGLICMGVLIITLMAALIFNRNALLKEREVPELALWEQFMVYATAFGIAKKVMKQLKEVYPELVDKDLASQYAVMNAVDSGIGDTISSSVASSVASIAASSNSSGYGGGGGFSGGGGGGGRRWRRRKSLKI